MSNARPNNGITRSSGIESYNQYTDEESMRELAREAREMARNERRLEARAAQLEAALTGMCDAYVALLLIKGEDPANYRSPILPYGKALAALSRVEGA